MSFAKALRCRQCSREYPLEPLFICEYCFAALEVIYDYQSLSKKISREKIEQGPLTMWRYKDLLPVDGEVVDLGTGFTPLIKAVNLGRLLGLKELYIKNDCVNPTYSFKDRVVSVGTTKAKEFGFHTLACSSTGNLAGAVAAHAAKARMKAFLFIPADLEEGKIWGTAVYAPTLIAVQGNYDQVNRLCSEVADKFPWAFVNINIRPYYAEGSKTLGYEVAEQLGWRAPDHCIVPAASGSLFTKIYKGLKELSLLGLIDKVVTRMYVAQASGCSPIVTAFQTGSKYIRPVKPDTIAKSLAVGNPADGYYALQVIRESQGGAVASSDEEIVEGMKLLAETEGIFAETAGGVVIAGLKHLVNQGRIKPEDVTIAFITGAGFKTLEAIERGVKQPIIIEPNLASFEKVVAERALLGQNPYKGRSYGQKES